MIKSLFLMCLFVLSLFIGINSAASNYANAVNVLNLIKHYNTNYDVNLSGIANYTHWKKMNFSIYNLTTMYYQNLEGNNSFENGTVHLSGNSLTTGPWGGYLITANILDGNPVYVTNSIFAVNSSWKVQPVAHTGYLNLKRSAQWVGIGGTSDPDLIQIGTLSYSANSFWSSNGIIFLNISQYNPVFELIAPDTQFDTHGPVLLTTPNTLNANGPNPLPVSPNDTVFASVKKIQDINSTTQLWFLLISDKNQHWAAYGDVVFPSLQNEGEVIDEDPTSSSSGLNLPFANFSAGFFGKDFAQSGNLSATANVNGKIKLIGALDNFPLELYYTSNAFNAFLTPDPITPDNSSFGITYSKMYIKLNNTLKVVNKNSSVSLFANVLHSTGLSNVSYQWFTANKIFGLTPVKVNGQNVTTSNLLIPVNSPTTFAVFVADNGITPNPIAYNYTVVKILPQIIAPTFLVLGQSANVQGICGNGDLCILTFNGLSKTGVSNVIYPWTPANTGNYSALLFDASEGLYANKTISVLGVRSSTGITLTNHQSHPTVKQLQQEIVVNSSMYNGINPYWNNVEFTTGPNATGEVLLAWVESNPSNSATNTTVWVKLNKSIGASGGTNTIWMDTLTGNIMSQSGPTGEAPQLSTYWGAYDDGAQVFNFYSDFSCYGASVPCALPSVWNASVHGNGNEAYYVQNGLAINATVASGSSLGFDTITSYPNSSVFEGPITGFRATGNEGGGGGIPSLFLGQVIDTFWCPPFYCTRGYYYYGQAYYRNGSNGTSSGIWQDGRVVATMNTHALPTIGSFSWNNGTNGAPAEIAAEIPGNSIADKYAGATLNSGVYLYIAEWGYGRALSANIPYVRLRRTPPANVMPNVTFGN